ncbi:probable mediator of RNA polymerase II transcription subunit 26c [Trifolium pratense]|uniref:Uncharacterized protein n=2 Tax=Trifolium pratense TaxID=57577 RepID=A0ACB0JCB7_TRIPR|nr:probable mediator of RNA polymerase II transcription subunit 26c [Trifolium pratense]CAJ2641593.1 unnamed protein product [Trifolium pratense]
MDLDDFRSILDTAGVDVWMFIDTAISVASHDNAGELKRRRDGIVERLYAATTAAPVCLNCDGGNRLVSDGNHVKKENSPSLSPERQQRRGGGSPATPQSQGNEDGEDEEIDPYGGLFEDEQKKILEIKELLEDPRQSDESLMELLQNLVDIDITFQELKETDIGRNVNQLRKHPSSDVRRLVKLLVKKWKEIVDEWVKHNPQGGKNTLMADGDSPLQKTTPNGHNHQIPDFAYSPNPHNGSSGSDRNNSEVEPKPKPKTVPRKDPPPKLRPSPPVTAPTNATQNRQREQKESNFDAERLATARKRLQANYKEAENAKKQRTIQVMDIHELPKSKAKNGYFPKNRGGGSSQGRQHW